jgi:hypothetical protein
MRVGLAASLLIGAIGIAVAAGCASSRAPGGAESVPSVQLPTPATITRHAVPYRVAEVAPAAAMRDGADSRAIKVFVYQSEDASQPQCSQLSPSARVAREDQRSVFIATFAYEEPGRGNVACLSVLSGDNSPPAYATLTVHLHDALGSRELLDVKTGRAIGIAHFQRPPTPSYVPPGYRQSLVDPFDAGSDFVAIRQYQAGTRTIEIRAQSATAWAQDGTVVDRIDVAGHRATITDARYGRCVTWTGSDALVLEVCASSPHGGDLSADELARIARSLHS